MTLRDPRQWDDRNDSYYLEKYKEYKGLKTLLALCFAEASETFHHWRVFSNGANGVCIVFDKHHIVEAFKKKCEKDGIAPIHGCLEYVKIDKLKNNPPGADDLPFRKWFLYRDEKEYRIVCASKKSLPEDWGFKIDLGCIDHISLSPWMPATIEKTLICNLQSISDRKDLRISRSRLIDYHDWKAVADKIVRNARRAPGTDSGSFDPKQLAGSWPGDEPLETLLAELD